MNRPIRLFRWKIVSNAGVIKLVKTVKNFTAKYIYDNSIHVMKYVINDVVDSITHCISQCLNNGAFPQPLKFAKVDPIFNKRDPALMENYRPVSIVSMFSKILEEIMFMQLIDIF